MIRVTVIEAGRKLRIYPFGDTADGMEEVFIEVNQGKISMPYAHHLGCITLEDAEIIVLAMTEAIRLARVISGR